MHCLTWKSASEARDVNGSKRSWAETEGKTERTTSQVKKFGLVKMREAGETTFRREELNSSSQMKSQGKIVRSVAKFKPSEGVVNVSNERRATTSTRLVGVSFPASDGDRGSLREKQEVVM